jgi:outer membrane protein TolC
MAAILAAASLLVAPVYAQAQEGQQSQQPAAQQQNTSPSQNPAGVQPQSQPAPQTGAAASDSVRDLRLGAGPDYSDGQRYFPNIIAPYMPLHVDEPMLTNSTRIDQLIQDGKLMLSLDDAISLALENNLNISVERFVPWIAQTQLLKAKAGGIPESGSSQQVVLGSSPSVSFDPLVTADFGWSHANIPVNNPFTAGTGTNAVPVVNANNAYVNLGYTQGFHTGTNLSVTVDTARNTSNEPDLFFNPAITPVLTATLTQPLLNGFGILPNTRYIIEAKNDIKIANSQFAQQVIATVTQTSNDYWELVYDRGNVKVEEAAVGVSQKLYEDNKKQLEIGTMAPLDVLTAESQLATDQQNLIVAQTTKLQQETVLLNDIAKNLLARDVAGIEIVPTTQIETPDIVENIALQDAVQEAWKKRPELFQADLNLKNAGIEVKATRNALLPTLDAFVQYTSQGLNGNRLNTVNGTTFVADTAAPIVDANGNQILIGTPGVPAFLGSPVSTTTISQGGLTNALKNVFQNEFPTYAVGVNLTLPVRNRSAQSDSARAQIDQRQQVVQYRQTENTIVINVRNALIALQQDRAQVAAADKARTLAQQTLDAEQKKYQLGSSTSYNVVLRSRDLTAAQGTALRAQANLTEALVNFNQAMGRTLEANHITVADALRGNVPHEPLIPGTPEAQSTLGAK